MYKLIRIPNQFIIVTDAIIKEDELFLMGNEVIQNSSLLTDEWCKSKQPKVIAEQNQIDFNGFEDIVGYIDVDKLAREKYLPYQEGKVDLNTGLKREGFKEGLNKAQELFYEFFQTKEWSIEIAMKEVFTGIISGGLNPIGEIGSKGLVHHTELEPRLTNNKIKITKINKHNKILN